VHETIRLGTMVAGITHRTLPLLAKIVATLDVLSGGRAICGLGIGWYEREHDAYGWRFPPTAERYVLLEDALALLPAMWARARSRSPPRGPGADTSCYRVRCSSASRSSSAAPANGGR
jgi:alkanesulfonate monooxygenase SsuD/methylene tetrahydromethanopterin reductase-like flavin-dependent oxidoreductase (luciferase family)